jgi:hypothetical protein
MANLGFPSEIIEAMAGISLGDFVLRLRSRHVGVSSSTAGETKDVRELMRSNGAASTSGLIVSVSPSLGVRHGVAGDEWRVVSGPFLIKNKP